MRSDLKGRGIGRALMGMLIDYARDRGIGILTGEVLAENTVMLALAGELRFTTEAKETGIVRVTLPLATSPRPAPPERATERRPETRHWGS